MKIVVLALASGLALVVAPAASAHTSLISETPADGDVLTELTDVELEFSEELLDIGNSVTLTDAEGTTLDLAIDLTVPRVLTAPLPADLTAGDYVVDWRVVANDGHPLEDTIAFTYAPAATPSESASPFAPGPASPSPESSESAAPVPTQISAPSPSLISEPSASAVPISAPLEQESSSSVWWWVIGIGLFVGIVVGVVVWRAGSRPATATDDPPSHSGDTPQS
ncbi:copper resistance CopC family protein [Demequina aurantiaca]|uniref:copper resistance CopC family protein n=1 Tax=Demequina aurantiaca TaxID=676200 RepID=UPI0007862650|nr:copper resistance protein CopC [Demequina aurantiaca]